MKIELNDHLDDMIDRLMSEDISNDELEKITKIARSLTEIAKIKLSAESQIIESKKLQLDTFKTLHSSGYVAKELATELKDAILLEKTNLEKN